MRNPTKGFGAARAHKRPRRRAAEQRDELAALSFYHLIGASEQPRRDRQAKRLRCRDIYDQLELRGLLNRRFCRLGDPVKF